MTYDQIFATSRDKMEEIMKEVHEKCINDKGFEQELFSNPTETLKKKGLELQPGMSFQIVKTEEEVNLLPDNVIPLSFGDKQDLLSVEDLDKVVGGQGYRLFDRQRVWENNVANGRSGDNRGKPFPTV